MQQQHAKVLIECIIEGDVAAKDGNTNEKECELQTWKATNYSEWVGWSSFWIVIINHK